ncbi:MAG: formyltetrahydrofolate deformylase [Gammaproteobacteria bacterium]|nr:formyltetrahydrofolate deformylase [Gammaproteobacteria bacterium]
MSQHAVLLLSCPDQKGLVATIADFLYRNNANILHADQHQDANVGQFFMRVEWDMTDFALDQVALDAGISHFAEQFQMQWRLSFTADRPRVAIFVSGYDHCLVDLLYRHQCGELACDIPLIISNHSGAAPLAEFHGIPFHHIPVTAETKAAAESKQLTLLDENRVDLVVLARYMQILSPRFVGHYPDGIINIHHSFLPAFLGANPYQRAFDRGVKLIGATSHYVTDELDEGPIIEQDVMRISHRDQLDDLIQKGRDLEKTVLSRAVRWHIQHRVLPYANKTVVFD